LVEGNPHVRVDCHIEIFWLYLPKQNYNKKD